MRDGGKQRETSTFDAKGEGRNRSSAVVAAPPPRRITGRLMHCESVYDEISLSR